MELAEARVKDDPFTYKCAYCTYTHFNLYYQQRHVCGRSDIHNKRPVMRIDCPNRFKEDGLPYKTRYAPMSLPEPKKVPWATNCL